MATAAGAQTPPQQNVYGSVPVTTTTSQIAAYTKAAQTGALTAVSGSPFADKLAGGAMAVDALGRFLFVVNPNTSNISMFQINQSTGSLTEVAGSPFSTGPTENPNLAPMMPVCLSAEKSGQFLYVGYRFGNFSGQGAVNEYSIDATNGQLVPLAAQPTTDIPSSPIGLLSDPKGLHLYVGMGVNATTGMQDAGTSVYSIDAVTGILGVVGSAGNAQTGGRSIAIDPQGRFFFDSWGVTQGAIDSAAISPADGTATTGISTVSLGSNEIASAMIVDGSGKFLYVQQVPAPVVYSVNQTTGALTVPPSSLSVLTFSPDSAAADPLGPYIYSQQADGIHAFLIDAQTGALSEIPGSPFTGAAGAQGTLAISGAPVQAVSGPVAALFPAAEDFASITVGQSSSSKLVTLTNTGGQGLSVNSIAVTGLNLGDFVATPNCSVPLVLPPNGTCTISIVFSPSAAGARQASLATGDNAPGSPQSIPLTGTGVAPQTAVTLVPGSLTFPTTAQGSTSPAQTVTLTSAGGATLHISSVLLSGANPGDFKLANTCNGAYTPNATCTMSVAFSPLGAGQRTASIAITDDAPDSPQSVQLVGTGQAPPPGKPAVSLSPGSISFGSVTQGTSAAPLGVTLTNSGTAPLHISSVVLGGANSSAVSMNNGCTASAYAVSATCTISATVASLATGLAAATITIIDDAPDSPQSIAISANVSPAFTISPAMAGGTSVTVTAGQTASFNLQLTPNPGFAGGVSFTCAGAPTAATCTAPSAQLNGTAVSYVVSVSTKGATSSAVPGTLSLPPGSALRMLSMVTLFVFLLAVVYICNRQRYYGFATRGFGRAVAAVVLLTAAIEIAGCGGGSIAAPQSIPIPTPQQVVTPQGTFTLTLAPTATTAGGTQLPPIAPIPLTLIVK